MKFNEKSVILITAFLLFYLIFGLVNLINYGQVNNTQDFLFHFGQSKGIDSDNPYWSDFLIQPNDQYPPLYHFIAGFFSVNEFVFYSFNLFLIIIIIPILLLKITETHWSTILYFFGVSFSHMAIYGATFPAMLVFVFVLVYFKFRKNPFAFCILFGLASLTHSKGALLFGLIFVAEIIDKLIKKLGLFGVGWLHQDTLNNPLEVIYLLIFHLPLPLFYFGFKNKDWFYWILLIAGLIASLIEFRTIGISQLSLIILASKPIQKTKNRVKLGLLLFLVFQALYYLLDFCIGTQKLIAWN